MLAVDGTTVNMPCDPKSQTFVHNAGTPKGYNQFHVDPLYDVLNKTYQHCVIQPQPKQDEVGALRFMLDWYDFPAKTLITSLKRGSDGFSLFFLFSRKAAPTRNSQLVKETGKKVFSQGTD